jgi:hypothetical protein
VSAREHRFRQLTQHFIDTFFSEIFDTIYLCNYYGVIDEVEEKGLIGIPFGKNSWTVRHRELVKTEHIVETWDDLTVEFINNVKSSLSV